MFDYNKNAFSPAGWATCSREQFDQLVDDPLVAMIADELLTIGEEYKAGRMDANVYNDRKSSLKKRLPAFAFHAHFPDGRRANKTAQPSGLCMIDLDHLADPHELWRKLYTQMKEQQEQHLDSRSDTRLDRLMLAHITPSGSGLRMVWRLPERYRQLPYGTNLADFQQGVHDWIAISTNSEPHGDPHVKDLARISFAVPRSYILHLDPALFDQPEAGRESSTSTEEDERGGSREENLSLDERGESREENGSAPAANDAHHSPFTIDLRSSLGCTRDSSSKLGSPLVGTSLHHSPKKDPAADPLQGLMGQIGQAVAECASPQKDERRESREENCRISDFTEVDGIPVGSEELRTLRVSECNPSLLGDCRARAVSAEPMKSEECQTADDPSNAADRDENPLRVDDTNDPAAEQAPSANSCRDGDNSWLRRECSRSGESSEPASPLAQSHSSLFTLHSSLKQAPSANPGAILGTPPKRGEMEGGCGEMEGGLHHSPFTIHHSLSFKGMAYSDIIDKYWQLMGGPPAEGERNTKLHQLAYHLRYICDFDADLLRKVMPTYGLSDKEMHDLIQSALKAPRYSYSNVMNKVLNALHLDPDSPLTRENCIRGDFRSPLPPDIPPDLPPLIDLLTRYSPLAYRPAVACAVFPPLATHLSNVQFRYVDNVEHEATLMCLLMAGSSAGKSCLTQPLNYIMADIRARDERNMIREKEWKMQCNALGANKNKPPRPEGLIIQEVDPDMTNPAFVLRMKEAEPHPLYACMNEVEQFDNLRGSRGGKQQFQIMCLAFDPGNRYGQTRVSNSAITEKVTVRFNWNASTTINKGQRYFKDVAADGPLSRINVCTILPQAIGEDMPVYGICPPDYPQRLQPYLDNLCQANGLILIPRATDFARRLIARNAEISSLTQDRVFEHLSFRAAVIAWLKACLLYVAQDRQWDERIEQFCQWSMDYDLWCKMRFFGKQVEQGISGERLNNWRRDNYLNKLKDTFSIEDLTAVIRRAGLKSTPSKILHVWTRRGFIRQTAPDQWQKIPRRSVLDELEDAVRGETRE